MEPLSASNRRLGLLWAVSASFLLHAGILAGLACWPAGPPRAPAGSGPVAVGFVTLADRGGPKGDPFLAGNGPSQARFEAPWARDLASAIQTSLPRPSSPPSPVGAPAAATSAGQPSGGPGSATGGGPGTGGGAGTGTTRFFGAEARGRRILYLIDASASMGRHGAWRPACREILASLRLLPADAEFQIWIYNRGVRALLPGRPGWSVPEAEVLGQVETALNTLQPEGDTDHAGALRLVLARQADAIFLLTDADDLPRGRLTALKPAAGTPPVLHALEIVPEGRAARPGELKDLAEAWNGTHRFLPLASLREGGERPLVEAFLQFRPGQRGEVGEP